MAPSRSYPVGKYANATEALKKKIQHPIIDGDGHTIEFMPHVVECMHEIGGKDLASQLEMGPCYDGMSLILSVNQESKKNLGLIRPPWWAVPAENTLDRATATFPKLLYERLDEIGLDFSVLYPTHGLFVFAIKNDELRQSACRAFNLYHSSLYGEYSDRLAPVAVIPMHTPEEAVAELDYAVGELGLKSVLMQGFVQRPVPVAKGSARPAEYLDCYGWESAYDYDPVWQKCMDLGVSPAFHASGMGWGSRMSTSSYVFNHLGNFATAQEAICRSLFLGGVTQRFPDLKFVFLEGGVGWACNLFSDVISHWEKRNLEAIQIYNPKNLDRDYFDQLFDDYAPESFKRHRSDIDRALRVLSNPDEKPESLNEFCNIEVESSEQLSDLFVENFYFGCEADDPINAHAFNTQVNPLGKKLKALFSSDISHWDVTDMGEVLLEAHELVDKEQISEQDFQSFTCDNAMELYQTNSPQFFQGTIIEDYLKK